MVNGKADVLVETNVAAAYMATQNKGKLQVSNSVFPTDTTFGVFTKKDSTLTAAIADALVAVFDNGALAKAADSYNLDASILDVR